MENLFIPLFMFIGSFLLHFYDNGTTWRLVVKQSQKGLMEKALPILTWQAQYHLNMKLGRAAGRVGYK